MSFCVFLCIHQIGHMLYEQQSRITDHVTAATPPVSLYMFKWLKSIYSVIKMQCNVIRQCATVAASLWHFAYFWSTQ